MNTEYLTRFPDGTLVKWRALTWEEYRTLVKLYGETLEGAAGFLLCEAAALVCVQDTEQDGTKSYVEDLYAGAVLLVGREILEFTGFISSTEKVKANLTKARERILSDWYESALGLICSVFHKDVDEVRKWTLQKFMTYCVYIEIASGKPLPVTDGSEEPEQKYHMTADGKKIPIISKQDLRRKNINMRSTPGPGE